MALPIKSKDTKINFSKINNFLKKLSINHAKKKKD